MGKGEVEDCPFWLASAAALFVMLYNSLLNVDYAKLLGCVR